MVVSSSQKIKPSEKVPHKIYQVPYKPGYLAGLIMRTEQEERQFMIFFKLKETLAGFCEAALNSTDIVKELKRFDLIIHDSPMGYCGALIGELLDIPRVVILPVAPNVGPFGLPHMIPNPISYVPQLLTGFTDKMTFVERVMNLGAYLGGAAILNIAFARPLDALKVKFNIKPKRSALETIGDAELVLITSDFALGYPQPLLPGVLGICYWEGCR